MNYPNYCATCQSWGYAARLVCGAWITAAGRVAIHATPASQSTRCGRSVLRRATGRDRWPHKMRSATCRRVPAMWPALHIWARRLNCCCSCAVPIDKRNEIGLFEQHTSADARKSRRVASRNEIIQGFSGICAYGRIPHFFGEEWLHGGVSLVGGG